MARGLTVISRIVETNSFSMGQAGFEPATSDSYSSENENVGALSIMSYHPSNSTYARR